MSGNGLLDQQTEDDFYKARNKALFNDLQHFMSPEESKLLSFSDVKNLLKPKNEVYLGMQVVPVDLIAGSEGRYHDFDNHFFPKNIHLKNRWASIDKAILSDVILPPIVLYEIGGLYFVRDGNHRVSVARTQGVENIDAEVVSLKSEIKLKPGMTQSQILKAVIQYEKRVFYNETGFGDLTDFWNLDFTSPGQYDTIYQHILTHKYYLSQNRNQEVSMNDSILSWYNTLYLPIVTSIKKKHIMWKFRGRTPSDLYVWIIKYWDDLKTKYGQDFSIEAAAEHFKTNQTQTLFQRLLSRFRKTENSDNT